MARKSVESAGKTRVPPQSLEAEQAALGAFLLEASAIAEAKALGLRPADFYREVHKTVCEVCFDLHERRVPVDLTTLGNELERLGRLEQAGGRPYLASLLDAVPTSAHLEHYARELLRLSALRGMIALGAELQEEGCGPEPAPPGVLLERLRERLGDLERRAAGSRHKGPVLETFTGAQLWAMDLADPACIVDGLIYEGLNIIAGAPKLGKSWLVLQLAVSVAGGAPALGHFWCRHAEVLYMALEDGMPRLRKRLAHLREVDPGVDPSILSSLHFRTEWPQMGGAGEDALRAWLGEHPACRLVIVDTFARVRKPMGKGQAYQEDYEAIAPLQHLALEHHIGIVVVHHTRKAKADDVFEEVSGTQGITGGADAMWVVKRPRKEEMGTVEVTGRDVDYQRHACKFANGFWSYAGGADELETSAAQQAILDCLIENVKAMTPTQVAAALGKERSNVQHQLLKMRQQGFVVQAEAGAYLPAVHAIAPPVSRDPSLPSLKEREREEVGGCREAESSDHSDHSIHSVPCDHSDHSRSQVDGGVIESDRGVIEPIHSAEAPGMAPLLGSEAQSDRSDRSDRDSEEDDFGAYSSDA